MPHSSLDNSLSLLLVACYFVFVIADQLVDFLSLNLRRVQAEPIHAKSFVDVDASLSLLGVLLLRLSKHEPLLAFFFVFFSQSPGLAYNVIRFETFHVFLVLSKQWCQSVKVILVLYLGQDWGKFREVSLVFFSLRQFPGFHNWYRLLRKLIFWLYLTFL
jgi:hypothetical protein